MYLAQLAGPITGIPYNNREAFLDATVKIAALGYQVWNPNDWQDIQFSFDPFLQPRRFWMQRSIRHLFRCDVVVMLPGWYFSSGAKTERDVALEFEIPVVYWSEKSVAYRCEWRGYKAGKIGPNLNDRHLSKEKTRGRY